MNAMVALKVDVDTDRGTRLGVPALVPLLEELRIPACFLFSLGPDNTGKAIRRVLRPGFLRKVGRTGVIRMYGLRTLLNGTLLPAPPIGRRNEKVMQEVARAGFEVGIHCHDHFQWQDHLSGMSEPEVRAEFGLARAAFRRIFGGDAHVAGAPGWQATAASRRIYDEAELLYSSDSRGRSPYFPAIGGEVFSTLEIPTTLPTFDELLGRPEFPDQAMVHHYLSILNEDAPNVFTLHAEIEGMRKLPLFRDLLDAWLKHGVHFVRMDDLARSLLARVAAIPVCELEMRGIDGRSGLVATQGPARRP